jgi:hypothetical protein
MLNTKNLHKTLALISIVGILTATAGGAFAADTPWQKNHPRREQINNRLANQNKRIKDKRRPIGSARMPKPSCGRRMSTRAGRRRTTKATTATKIM